MAEPSNASLSEQWWHAQWASGLQDFGVCHSVLPPAGAEGSGRGIRWVAALFWHRPSTTRCHKGESTGHKLGRRTSWSFRSTGHCPTLACWVWPWQQLLWRSCIEQSDQNDLSIEQSGAGAQVGEGAHNLQLRVVDGDDWGGGDSAPCARMLVFLRLIVSPNSLQALPIVEGSPRCGMLRQRPLQTAAPVWAPVKLWFWRRAWRCWRVCRLTSSGRRHLLNQWSFWATDTFEAAVLAVIFTFT